MLIYYDDDKHMLEEYDDTHICYRFTNLALIQTTTVGKKKEASNILNDSNDHWQMIWDNKYNERMLDVLNLINKFATKFNDEVRPENFDNAGVFLETWEDLSKHYNVELIPSKNARTPQPTQADEEEKYQVSA
jgi:hypothetical protein